MILALLHNRSFSWTAFPVYAQFLVGWLVMFAAYLAMVGPLRRHFPGSQPVPRRMVASFTAGMLVMFFALQGPLHDLSDYFLFSAHMVQHLLLILLMPPLLLSGIPDWMLRPVIRVRPIGWIARVLTFPVVAFLLNNVIFTAWHFPVPYDLMMRNHDVHVLMHLMIMVTGTIMWWPILSPIREAPRLPGPLQMVYLFILGIPMMIVAALITYSSQVLYPWYAEAPRLWGLTPLADQQMGGAIMWVPGGLGLWLAITWVYFRWSSQEEPVHRTPDKPAVTLRPLPFPDA